VFAPNKVGLHLDLFPHDVLSEDFEILSFDLTQSQFSPARRMLTVTATGDGCCVGAAQWLRLDLDSETTYENRPKIGTGPNGWMHVLYRFRNPIDVKAGDKVHLVACQNRTAMILALA
jgi:hypothetical protein